MLNSTYIVASADSDSSLPGFQPPKTWDYVDDQIPAWYKEWEQTPAEETGIGRNRRRGA